MGKRLRNWEIGGFFWTVLAGTALHFLYDWTGGAVWASVVSAVNESVWEHMKLLFVPAFVFTLAQQAALGRQYPNLPAVRAVSLTAALLFLPAAYYAYTGALGVHALWADILLFVLAIAIHKLPEGLATGIVFDAENLQNSYTVAVTIALQNIPEGMVVVTPLMMIGVKMGRVVAVSLSIALLEVVGVVLGCWLGDLSSLLLPALTALAGGAMLYVISDEMIPETHAHGFEKPATCALVAGVLAMLFVEKMM